MSLLSPISKSLTSVAPKLVTLLLICLPATAAFAQSPAQQNPAPSSTAPTQATLGNAADPFASGPCPPA